MRRGFPSSASATAGGCGLPPAAGWLADGSLHTEETVVEGIEQAPAAFLAMLRGANTGKMLVRLPA